MVPSSALSSPAPSRIDRSGNCPTAPLPGVAATWLSSLLELTTEALLAVGADGTVLCSSREARTLLGRSAAEFAGRSFGEWWAACINNVTTPQPTLQSLEREPRTEEIRQAGGIRQPVTVSAAPGGPNEEPAAYWVFLRPSAASPDEDLNARRLAAIVESSDDAIVSKDLNGIVESWNGGAERIFGYSPAEMIGRPILMLIPEDRQDEETRILDSLRRGLRIEHYETVRRRKDGTLIDVSITVSPLFNRSGRVVGASKIARDITAQKNAARELAIAHAKAVEANRAKDVFLAKLSHELRTPLNPVLLVASEAAADTSLTPKIRHDFQAIREAIELEARLVDDLLDLAKITRGKLQLELGRHDLRKILNEVLSLIAGEVREKDQLLRTEIADRPITIIGDAVRLQQVCWNLLKNAVKFTPPGGLITVRLQPEPERKVACIAVSDTGRGIASQEAAFIFEPFMQGGATGIGSAKGLGLGLTIAKQIVELHGGAIQSFSAGPGSGATFTVELPAVSESSAPNADPPSNEISGPVPSPRRLVILLVEDHEPSQRAMQRLLANRGHQVVAVRTAADARRAIADARYDLAIVDLGLPDANGADLIGEFRSGGGPRCIALSGYGRKEDVDQCLASGALAHLTKPISIQALDKTLSELGASP